jgi:methylated-DNA-protein-cysteine methyltransferase-like protein
MGLRERARPRRRVGRESPPPAAGSAYPRIDAVVTRIPRGRVATYGQVAAEAGMPHAPRVAGYALHALPPGSAVPWHRVVAAGGRLSLGKLDPSSAITQRLRLEHEGVRFDGRGCVDMERYSWQPRARRRARGVRERTPRGNPGRRTHVG